MPCSGPRHDVAVDRAQHQGKGSAKRAGSGTLCHRPEHHELSYDNMTMQFTFSVAIGGNKILIKIKILLYTVYNLTMGKSRAQCTLTKNSLVMYKPRPLCFHVADDVGCVTVIGCSSCIVKYLSFGTLKAAI